MALHILLLPVQKLIAIGEMLFIIIKSDRCTCILGLVCESEITYGIINDPYTHCRQDKFASLHTLKMHVLL